ncbi:MAG: PAS domain-containing sensor histidine kinase [Granulosicoccus sp.]
MKASPGKHYQESLVEETVHKPDWDALRLLNQYRLLIILALGAVYYLPENQRLLGSNHPAYFIAAHAGFLVVTLTFMYLRRIQSPALNTQFFVQNYLDILFICVLMFSSGGISSGLGPLLVINIALLSHLSNVRHSLLFAAIATIFLIGEELLASLLSSVPTADFQATALLGSLLFLTAWLMTVPLRRLLSRQLVKSTHSRAVLDVRQIAQLNEEIIRELDSGVLVVDHADNVQLMNDMARMLLAVEFASIPLQMKKISADLLENMNASRRSPTLQTSPFEVSSTGQTVLPRYTRLSTGGMLIRLDDHSLIRQQFQQLKLASLGRLSASIAHEIRNPLGAISYAVQLIEESDSLNPKDADLLVIARRHTQRINRIIEDVLQLSNRDRVQLEPVHIDQVLTSFVQRFIAENSLNENQLRVSTEPCLATMDAGHLDQIMWNLCTNALLHNDKSTISIQLSCCNTGQGTTQIDISDTGKGISDIDRDNLFEPFYSTHQTGTGLGLFIIRELCELNNANIESLPAASGAHFRVTLSSAQDMAA